MRTVSTSPRRLGKMLNHEGAHLSVARILRLVVASFEIDRTCGWGCVTVRGHSRTREHALRRIVAAMAGPYQDGKRFDPTMFDVTDDGDLGVVSRLCAAWGVDAAEFFRLERRLGELRATRAYRDEMRRAVDDLKAVDVGW